MMQSHILPLKFHIDQDTLNFFIEFFSFMIEKRGRSNDSPNLAPFIRMYYCRINMK